MPVGPLGSLHFGLDAVSALFLLIVAGYGAAAADSGAKTSVLAMAFGLMSAASGIVDRGGRPGLEQAAFAVLCLLLAVALLAPGAGTDLQFAAMRATPPQGAAAAAVLALTVLGAGSRLVWPTYPSPVQPSPGRALLHGGRAAVAVYVLIRVLFDLCGPSVPMWWGLPLMVLGAAVMVLGGVRANTESDLLAILAACRIGAAGFIVTAIGVALAARGADAMPLAALALAGGLLHATGHAVFDMLLVLCGSAVQRSAGTFALAQLGGLIRSMPGVTLGMLAGAACLAGLPLTAGFTGRWLLLQSLLGMPLVGGFWLKLGVALVLVAITMGAGLAAAGAVRLIGIGFLGRPRTPATAAAQDAPRPMRLAIIGLSGMCVLLGVWPSIMLALVQPALQRLLALQLEGGGWLAISAQLDGPGYNALGIAFVLALSGAAVVGLVRRFAVRGGWLVPVWQGGLDPAPPGLPCGDPTTQYSAASASRELIAGLSHAVPDPRALRVAVRDWAARVWRRLPRPNRHKAGALLLAVAGLLLWVVR